jgi:hypothetical protein
MSNLTKSDFIIGFLKILMISSLFFYIRTLNIADNHKFILTIVPSIFILIFNKIVTNYKNNGGNKPIYVKKNDTDSDINLYDEFFIEDYENFESHDLNDKLIIIPNIQNNIVKIYEVEKPFWISKGYFDISNPNNFIVLDNLNLTSNYTIELWLKLNYVSNNNILSFFDINSRLLFQITYDQSFLYLGKTTKIPISNKTKDWFQLVIMRGKYNTLGSNRGFMYINGIFLGYIEDLPDLTEVSNGYLFKYSNSINELLEYNKNYNDLCNCSIVRIYNRSLSLDELQNNYLKEASYYELEEVNRYEKSCVQDDSLVLYLDSRLNGLSINSKKSDWLEMAKQLKQKKSKVIKLDNVVELKRPKVTLKEPKVILKESNVILKEPKVNKEVSLKKPPNKSKKNLKTTKPIL